MQLPPLRGADDVDAVLAPLGVTSTCLRALLGETPASLARRMQTGPAPEWYLHFQRLWEQGERTQHLPKSAPLDVIELVRPLVDGALEELAVRGEALTHEVPEPAEAVRGALNATLSEHPLADLAPIIAPTGVLEVHLMKSAGRLFGNTPEERYESFIHLLHDPEVREELLSKYVELARIVTTRLMFWVERRLDFLRAYRDDRAELAHLLGADTVMITDVEFGAGDSHCEGRTVAIVTTDAGRVVYKPRAGIWTPHSRPSWTGRTRGSRAFLCVRCVPWVKAHTRGWSSWTAASPPMMTAQTPSPIDWASLLPCSTACMRQTFISRTWPHQATTRF